jgi:MAC/Perforin domain
MAEYFNQKSGLSDKVPLGSFNSMFSFNGCWKIDASGTKALAVDGYSVPLYKAKLVNPNLVLNEDVKRDLPAYWDPPSLARLVGNTLFALQFGVATWLCFHILIPSLSLFGMVFVRRIFCYFGMV